MIANSIDADMIDVFFSTGKSAPDFKKLSDVVDNVYKTTPGIEVAYVYQPRVDGIYMVYSTIYGDDTSWEVGDKLEYESDISEYVSMLIEGTGAGV